MKNNLALIFILFVFSCNSTKKIQHSIMIDGVITSQEWKNSKSIKLGDNYHLNYQEDENYYYLSIKRKDVEPMYIDLYIEINSIVYNVHASQQLGERFFTDTTWDDKSPAMKWGFQREKKFWVANIAKTDRVKIRKLMKEKMEANEAYKKSVIPYDGYEFQFQKNAWDLKNAKIRIEVRDMFEYPKIITFFPNNSTRKNTINWINFKF